jgi:hypothetical protein
MPGLTAPSDYAEEPPRHPDLRINSKVRPPPSYSAQAVPSRGVGLACAAISAADSGPGLIDSRVGASPPRRGIGGVAVCAARPPICAGEQ